MLSLSHDENLSLGNPSGQGILQAIGIHPQGTTEGLQIPSSRRQSKPTDYR